MRVSLATRISLSVIGVLLLAALSNLVAIRTAYRYRAMQETIVADNFASMQAAEELEIALLEQRGYVSSYILSGGEEDKLSPLSEYGQRFDDWLERAHSTARSDEERRLLVRLQSVYQDYEGHRDEVVKLYRQGHEQQAVDMLLGDVTSLYRQSYDVCEELLGVNQQMVDTTSRQMHREVDATTWVIGVVFLLTCVLGAILLWLFLQGVIFPLRQMAVSMRSASGEPRTGDEKTDRDELRELQHYVQLLMTDVEETRSDLERSRSQLANADRLAAVGKLAASVAHEIRNPLTAIKMWLYSIRRSVAQEPAVLDKFEVVSEELGRLEKIVQNFLEFSRPPRLTITQQPIWSVLDKTIELLRYRLSDEQIEVVMSHRDDLPDVAADSEQLRQVFLNLVNNAIDAMSQGGGTLTIHASGDRRKGSDVVVVQVADSGGGIPEPAQHRLFEPFYSSKETGTGLGLCVAASIMARHGGGLELISTDERGTKWAVVVPCDVATATIGGS